jgi:hypothetical protein
VEEAKEVVLEDLETVEEASGRTAREKRRSEGKRKKKSRGGKQEEDLERKVMKMAKIVAVLLFLLVLYLIIRHLIWPKFFPSEESRRPHIEQSVASAGFVRGVQRPPSPSVLTLTAPDG